jgi:hypothetical protein
MKSAYCGIVINGLSLRGREASEKPYLKSYAGVVSSVGKRGAEMAVKSKPSCGYYLTFKPSRSFLRSNREWAMSPEGRSAMAEAARQSSAISARFRGAGKLNIRLLNEPVKI